MKHKILFTLSLILLIGIALAQSGLLDTSKSINMDKAKIDILKQTAGARDISPKVSAIACNDKECWASIYQSNLIQTEFRIEKQMCIEANQTTGVCISSRDYTNLELESMRNVFVKARLEGYADYLLNKSIAVPQDVVGGGTITFVTK